ncbi:MAG: molecular chaperone DnaJ [Acidothermus sp.]|nr:molecular chaperone DnaJ [Acidothermus sp.]
MARDHYATLGVRRDATQEEIKRAYRRLARQLHPDVNPDRDTQERFKEITAAYEVLSDPEKRRIYDMGGDPLSAGGGFGDFAGGFGGLSDLVDAFFGTTSRGPRSRVRRGADALVPVQIDLADAVFGTTVELTVDTAVVCPTCTGAGTAPGTHPDTCPMCRGRGEVSHVTRSFLGQMMTSRPCPQCGGVGTVIRFPCPECAGDGRVRVRRTIEVSIPAGVEHGMRIRLAGEGEVGPGGGPAGDLYVEIEERRHPVFRREGSDLHATLQVPMTAAALGTTLTLETFDGPVPIDVKPGTQSGTVITLRGKGVPRLRGMGRGDLHVHLEVLTPTKLDDEQAALLRKLAELRGEEIVEGSFKAEQQGLFSRIRDAFNGR